mgnify:CR=1 FL=1
MNKHTPGPWSAHYNNEGLTVFSPDNVTVAYVDYDECEERPVEANAHLIAAAPALLEALKNVLEFYEWSNSNGAEQAAYDKAMKALAQAEGTNR